MIRPLPLVKDLALNLVNGVRYGRNVTLGPGFTFRVLPIGDLRSGAPCWSEARTERVPRRQALVGTR